MRVTYKGTKTPNLRTAGARASEDARELDFKADAIDVSPPGAAGRRGLAMWRNSPESQLEAGAHKPIPLLAASSGSVEADGLRTRTAQSEDVAALLAEAVVTNLLALELEPAALLAVVPAAAVEREIALAAIEVLVLWHQRDRRLSGQVSELAEPEPQADWEEGDVHKRQPQQELPLVLCRHHHGCAAGRIQVEDPRATRVPLGEEACDVEPAPGLLRHRLRCRGRDRGGACAHPCHARGRLGGAAKERHPCWLRRAPGRG